MSSPAQGLPTQEGQPTSLVSVVMPTRDRAPFLKRAIQSVLAQSFRDWELVVVDDASTDDTVDVVRSFADPRLRVVQRAESGGASRARNDGVNAGRSPLVAFLDSDDEWLATKLEHQIACLKRDDRVAVVYCREQRIDDRTNRRAPLTRKLPAGDAFAALVTGWNPTFSSIVVQRSILEAVGGFDPTLPAFNDHDVLLRIAQTGSRFAAIADVLVIKHDYGAPQISTTPDRLLRGFERMDQKWAPILLERSGAAAYRRWRAQLYTKAQHARVRDAVARGRYLTAWSGALASCRFAPWAGRAVASSMALAALGPRGYAMLLRVTDRLARVLPSDV